MKRLCTLFAALLLGACKDDSETVKAPPTPVVEKITESELLVRAVYELGEFEHEAKVLQGPPLEDYDAAAWTDLFARWGEWEHDFSEQIAELERGGVQDPIGFRSLVGHLENSGRIKDYAAAREDL